ncbi:hypothetical protein [Actinobaculum sp. 313]|uniref:hypothetical protein n=1 Tax=Actinobaculum sp. 313 TaxID=2495645 RepID=UPI000F73C402|nr:hypothetical protein [Actinobaculum sp. 313]
MTAWNLVNENVVAPEHIVAIRIIGGNSHSALRVVVAAEVVTAGRREFSGPASIGGEREDAVVESVLLYGLNVVAGWRTRGGR